MTQRDKLKGYFTKGARPTALNFAELIDSVPVREDDGLLKLPAGPLSVAGLSVGASYANIAAPANGLIVEGSVGVGTTEPKSPLSVAGALAVGTNYAKIAAPANGLIVEGKVGIGTPDPGVYKLRVSGDMRVDNNLIVQGSAELCNMARVEASTEVRTSSTALVDLPDMSHTFTSQTTETVLIFFNASFALFDADYGKFRMLIKSQGAQDIVLHNIVACGDPGGWQDHFPVSISSCTTLTPGSYTIKIRWAKGGHGGSAELRQTNIEGCNRTLHVIRLKMSGTYPPLM